MLVREARTIATEWVRQHASGRPDFCGAFFTGSTASMSADSVIPATSDVDVMVVLSQPIAPPKPGKLVSDGVLLEISYLESARLENVDRVAESYHLAHSFSRDNVIADPTGRLRELYRLISCTFADPASIKRRYENAISKIEAGLGSVNTSAPWHEQVTAWMFPTSITTHVLLVAARQNPTVRLRYFAARTALQRHGLIDLYPQLLDLLGCRTATRQQVQHHLHMLGRTFDTMDALARTKFFFSSDISLAARPIAIEGSQRLIDGGNHPEAVFWIIATYARCQQILAVDAPADLQHKLEPDFRAAVAELLHVNESSDLLDRAEEVRKFLPVLRAAASAIAGQTVEPC